MRGYMEKWPRENCDFFRVDCEKNEKIKIVSCGNLDKDFFEYASNFLEAANVVAYEMLDSGDIATLDVDFFNLAFFYRHSLELILKAIGFQHIKGKEEREKFLNDTFHNLSKILKYIEPVGAVAIVLGVRVGRATLPTPAAGFGPAGFNRGGGFGTGGPVVQSDTVDRDDEDREDPEDPPQLR